MIDDLSKRIELMKIAQERLSKKTYISQDLAGQYRERLSVYTDVGLDDNTIFATEIGFLWEFIDKGLGSAVGWAGIFDEIFAQKNNKGGDND